MARGTRAPSQHAYRGSIGRTQTTTVHVTGPRGDLVSAQVYTTIDAVEDPELVDRLHADTLNAVRADGGEQVRIPVPVVYHDPAAELMVLVLADAHRHRELDERIALLQRMRDDDAPIPAYAKDFTVVYNASGLRTYLERRAQEALESARALDSTRDAERRRAELAMREGELDRARQDNEKRTRELERRAQELEAAKAENERARSEIERARAEIERLKSEARNRVIAAAQQAPIEASESTTIGPVPNRDESETRPVAREDLHDELDEIETSLANLALAAAPPAAASKRADSEGFESVATNVVNVDAILTAGAPTPPVVAPTNGVAHAPPALAVEFDDDETTGSAIIPQGSDPLTTETVEQPLDVVTDGWLDKVSARDHSTVVVEPGGPVRLALVAGEQLARGLGGNLDLRILLHRTQFYPVITLVIGPPAALRVPSTTQLAIIPLDIAVDPHRAVLAALGRKFELLVDLVVRGRRIRRVRVAAPLAENVGYILRAAEDHLRGLTSSGDGTPSYERGRDLVLGAGFDLLGTENPEAGEFRDDKLAQLQTAQHLRRAIAMARRFARPSREDYLVCTRGFPLPRWRELRRHVLESAVAWGLWMGPELAQVAVSEGLARSRRDLVVRLDQGFDKLKRHATAFDIDADAADDNLQALSEEARGLGVELARAPKNGTPVTSEEVSVVSGSIGVTPPTGLPQTRSTDDLISDLDDRTKRVNAAILLCDRADGRAAAPVIAAVTKMSRAEAVRVLGMSVKFGEAAAKPLTEGLTSSKGFLRHGCALALALLRTEDGTQAVIDLLLAEPTEIWREVARAIGQVGPTGLMPLASNYGRLGERATPQAAERVAWAMAHIAVRGGRSAVEVMANGQSLVAPVARHALELHASAANDQVRVRPGADGSQAGKDVTVNRAFSRRFFEALEQGLPDAGQAGLEALDASSPMELLDEADLIDEDEDEAELDEADLIQT